MPKERFSPEQIIAKLRQIEVQLAQGKSIALALQGRCHLTRIDEDTRECLALNVARRINSFGVIETLTDAMLAKDILEHVRCDNVLCGEAAGALGQQISARRFAGPALQTD